jgi:toxin YoeB
LVQRNLLFTSEGWDDYTYWIDQDKKTLKKINKLIADILRNPFEGLGKPEPLNVKLPFFRTPVLVSFVGLLVSWHSYAVTS